MSEQHDVIVVGAGPVGLALALGLARSGVDVLVLEAEAGTAVYSRAPAIWPRTQEILAGLGVLERFEDEGILKPCPELWDADRQRTLLRLPIEELRDETPYARMLILPQSETERLLSEALQRTAGGEVRFGCAVTALSQDATGVVLCYRSGGDEKRVRARFVAGCDGAHSTVRHQIGGVLEGCTYRLQAALADVTFASDPELPSPRLTTRPKLAIAIRVGRNLWRLILPFAPHEPDWSLEKRLDAAVGSLFPPASYETVWQSEFSLHNRISSRWVDRRVVLAGDAAHLNSPVGGEGMNAGIIDTLPLRQALLAALADGDGTPLEDYAQERRNAVATGVNRFTDLLTRALTFRGGSAVRPLLRLAGLLMRLPALRRRVLRRVTMLR